MYMPPNQDANFTPPPAGTHLAVCYRVIDLGTQQIEWNQTIKHQRKVLISWELPDERMEDDAPFTVHQRYTLSSSERAKLRKDLEAWRGRKFREEDFGPGGFDIQDIIGCGCLLSLVHNEKGDRTYTNINSVSALAKGMTVPDPINERVYFSLDDKPLDGDVLESLSEGIQNAIKSSPEYMEQVRTNSEPPMPQSENDYGNAPDDDEIPF